MVLSALKFLLPFLLWLFLLRDFLSGVIPVNMDTNTIYGVAKYYFNNLLNGVVPLWDPFVSLGRPFYAISICNLFNPVTLLVPLLKFLGCPYNIAFNMYMAGYFFLTCIGFYFLAKRVLKDKAMAYLAYVAFMFSSVGPSIFTQLTFLEILSPAIWFFFFLIAFAQERKPGYFLGLTLSVMANLAGYLPFYFLTVAFVFFLLFALLYFKPAVEFCKHKAAFVRQHRLLSVACAAGLLIAAGPLLAYKVLDASGDVVAPGRHCQYVSAQECYDRTMGHKGGMLHLEIVRSGGLGERLDLGYLFAHQDKLTYGSDSLFFVPVWVYLVIVLSVFLRLERLTVVLAGMMALIGFIALGDSSPLHRVLYDTIFFFKYFRNLFFLGVFLIPLAILLAFKQLQALLALNPRDFSGKKIVIVGILAGHAAFYFFLSRYPGVMPASFVTVGLSAAAFLLYYLGRWPKEMLWIFAAILVVQPVVFLGAYRANAEEFKCVLPSAHVKPVFAWARPLEAATSPCRIYQFARYEDFWYAMSMTDAPPKVDYPQSAPRWTFDLARQTPPQTLAAYAQYKIYVFDDLNSPGVPLRGPSKILDVAHFDANRAAFKTNFDRRTFLVYNDSFTNSWQAFVDGKKEKIERTNGAFKGVWVPKGEHTLEFRYAPPGGQWVYVLTTVGLLVFLIWTICALRRQS